MAERGTTTAGNDALVERIDRLRKLRRAVILAHNYQLGEVQDVADFCGDSLELSRKAAASEAEVIVFCGVHFMAETAAILSPGRTVLLPDAHAGCPMADMIDAAGLRKLKAEHPDAAVVCYVNTTAEVKAESDICCTSSNAPAVVRKLAAEPLASSAPERELIFVPDRHLGGHVERVTGRRMVSWPGFCPTHVRILPEHIERRRREYPDAMVMVHPECRADVAALADAVLSTGGMIRAARETASRTIVVGTEVGILHRLQRENPDKVLVAATEQAICPNMKRITLEKVLWALEEMREPIRVPEPIRVEAERAIRAMIDIG